MIHSWHITVSWEAVLSAENSGKPLGSRGSDPNSAGGEGGAAPSPRTPLRTFGLGFRPFGPHSQSTSSSFPVRCLGVWIKHWVGPTLQRNWRSPRVVRFSWLAINDPVYRSMIPRVLVFININCIWYVLPGIVWRKNVNTDRIMNFFYEKCMLKRAPCRLRGCKNSISWPDVVQGD